MGVARKNIVPDERFASHRGRLALSIGKRTSLEVEVAITSGGLLAIGGLVSMILLSTAVIVRAAKAEVGTRS